MGKIKIKYKAPVDHEAIKEFRSVDNRSLNELASEYATHDKSYMDGFNQAKKMITHFLMQKQIGYGDAFFFKISDLEEIGKEN